MIAAFADAAERRISRLIRAKRRLIDLLTEQKQAMIQQAVTRGLDTNVRSRPSGVEWIGDVPEHWEICQIGHLAKVGNGSTPSRGNADYWSAGEYPWLNSASVNEGTINKADQFVTSLALRECHLPRVRANSVLIAITGQGKTRGTAALLAFEATINQHLAYITPGNDRVLPAYLKMYLAGAYAELRAISDNSGSTKGALTYNDVKHFKVALPAVEEQVRLVAAIRREVADIEASVERIRRQIDLLREYRARLIADVVTGQLDVRGVELPAGNEELLEDVELPEDAISEDLDAEEDASAIDE